MNVVLSVWRRQDIYNKLYAVVAVVIITIIISSTYIRSIRMANFRSKCMFKCVICVWYIRIRIRICTGTESHVCMCHVGYSVFPQSLISFPDDNVLRNISYVYLVYITPRTVKEYYFQCILFFFGIPHFNAICVSLCVCNNFWNVSRAIICTEQCESAPHIMWAGDCVYGSYERFTHEHQTTHDV